MVYEADYRNLIGWYAKTSWIKDRAKRTDNIRDHDFTLSGGVSVLFWSWDRKSTVGLLGVANALRLRLGPRVNLVDFDDFFDGTTFEIQLSFRQ